MVKHNEVLDEGNCGRVTDRGKEAVVKLMSLRTGTSYKAGHPGELAQHCEAQDSRCSGKRRGCVRIDHAITRGDLVHVHLAETPGAPRAAMQAVMSKKSAEAIVDVKTSRGLEDARSKQ